MGCYITSDAIIVKLNHIVEEGEQDVVFSEQVNFFFLDMSV